MDGMKPLSQFATPLLTDLYQITMAYGYWKAGRHNDEAVFDLYFRRNPFCGEYTVFAGLEECLRFVKSYKFSEKELAFLKSINPHFEDAFLDYLRCLEPSALRIYAIEEGSVVFPRVPLIRVEGPLALAQLMETTFLVLVNYASLIATNAARHRYIVGDDAGLLEFGLRRAQGPDGGMSASRYSVMGGFDGTSNVQAAHYFGIPCRGTHAHSFVSSFSSLQQLKSTTICDTKGNEVEFLSLCVDFRSKLCPQSNEGELAAFICYAQAFPNGFLALIDTYSTLGSGIYNFLAVSLALAKLGYEPVGMRLDSGDLAYFSRECRRITDETAEKFGISLRSVKIFASNDINEDVLYSLYKQGHCIDMFGVGTHLVTCQKQPALGCVYKLVEVNGLPRIKVSQDLQKVTIPGRKAVYRLWDSHNMPVLDLMAKASAPPPQAGVQIRAKHPITESKRVDVIPSRVEELHKLFWAEGKIQQPLPSLKELKEKVHDQVGMFREDYKRYLNPSPYKVSMTEELFQFMHTLWLSETPVEVIS